MTTRMRSAGLLALASLLAAACTVQAPPAGGGGAPPADTPRRTQPVSRAARGDAREVHDLVNAHRRRAGCAALAWDDRAAAAAQAHSEDMARRRYFAHESPEGVGPAQRLEAAGVLWRRVAENVALTSAGPDDAVRLWLGSSAHRENIENCDLTHAGVGVSGDRWTQLFFTPR